MKSNEYRCDMCKEIYEKGQSEEDAVKELKDNFFTDSIDIVCDDCYNKMFKEKHDE